MEMLSLREFDAGIMNLILMTGMCFLPSSVCRLRKGGGGEILITVECESCRFDKVSWQKVL